MITVVDLHPTPTCMSHTFAYDMPTQISVRIPQDSYKSTIDQVNSFLSQKNKVFIVYVEVVFFCIFCALVWGLYAEFYSYEVFPLVGIAFAIIAFLLENHYKKLLNIVLNKENAKYASAGVSFQYLKEGRRFIIRASIVNPVATNISYVIPSQVQTIYV